MVRVCIVRGDFLDYEVPVAPKVLESASSSPNPIFARWPCVRLPTGIFVVDVQSSFARRSSRIMLLMSFPHECRMSELINKQVQVFGNRISGIDKLVLHSLGFDGSSLSFCLREGLCMLYY